MLVGHHQFTVEKYHRMIETGVLTEADRVELVRGEIFDMTPIGRRHAACVKRLNLLLNQQVAGQALVSVQDPIRLGEDSEPEPDVALVAPRDDFYESRLPRPTDVWLLVEVADTSLPFDRKVKLPLYAEHEIPEVWLVDLVKDRIEVHRQPAGSAYQSVQVLRAGDPLEVQRLEGITLSVSDII